mmetsp:Transcript_40419/g.97566  ORF Transcript_40419/g.97566 Transcript_40419/m.97566 type:complete len:210 (-) Transcript_40419:962-1591(-)
MSTIVHAVGGLLCNSSKTQIIVVQSVRRRLQGLFQKGTSNMGQKGRKGRTDKDRQSLVRLRMSFLILQKGHAVQSGCFQNTVQDICWNEPIQIFFILSYCCSSLLLGLARKHAFDEFNLMGIQDTFQPSQTSLQGVFFALFGTQSRSQLLCIFGLPNQDWGSGTFKNVQNTGRRIRYIVLVHYFEPLLSGSFLFVAVFVVVIIIFFFIF